MSQAASSSWYFLSLLKPQTTRPNSDIAGIKIRYQSATSIDVDSMSRWPHQINNGQRLAGVMKLSFIRQEWPRCVVCRRSVVNLDTSNRYRNFIKLWWRFHNKLWVRTDIDWFGRAYIVIGLESSISHNIWEKKQFFTWFLARFFYLHRLATEKYIKINKRKQFVCQ